MRKVLLGALLMIFTGAVWAQGGERVIVSKGYRYTNDQDALDLFNVGVREMKSGNFEKAIGHFKHSLAFDGKFVECLDNMALCYRKTWKLDSAQYFYEKSLELFPTGKVANFNLAVVHEKRKNYQLAFDYYKYTVKVAPEHADACYGAARMAILMKNYKAGLKYSNWAAHKYRVSSPDQMAKSHYLQGIASYYLGDRDKAVKLLGKAQKKGITVPEELVTELRL